MNPLASKTAATSGVYWVFYDGRYVACELRIIGVTLRQLRRVIIDGDSEHLGPPFFPLSDLTQLREICRMSIIPTL